MSKKTKRIVVTIVTIVVLLFLARIVLIGAILVNKDEGNYEEPTTTSAAEELQIPEETETTTPWIINPQFLLCLKTEKGFIEKDFTAATAENLADVKTMKVSDGKAEVANFEVRLYGVPLGAQVTVTCESMATKAYKVNVGQNDGAYQYYYWQPRMYSASEEGEYTFKVTIKEAEGSDAETVIYYKMAV